MLSQIQWKICSRRWTRQGFKGTLLLPLNFGKWENGENPKPGIPKKGEGEGHLTPAPTVEAFRSDLSAEPHQEAHGRAGKLVLSNFHQVESPVFNAKQVSCRWHLCAAERRGRGAPKKVATQAI